MVTRTQGACVTTLLWLSVASASAAEDPRCKLKPEETEKLLALPFAQFDQQEGSGWRPLYRIKCYSAVANLLVEYLKRHPEPSEGRYMLPFHAGVMFASDGRYEQAIDWMKQSYSDAPSTMIDWNAFVDATIAFLRHDLDELLKLRKRIDLQPAFAEGPGVPKWAAGKKMNLDVVDGYINCFNETYDVAYSLPCREKNNQDK